MIMPEITPYLSVGYVLSGHPHQFFKLKPTDWKAKQLGTLCESACEVLQANVGIPLSSRRLFPSAGEEGTITIFSDASGVDGVGGYATLAGAPDHVFIMSATWPTDVKIALDNCAARAAERPSTGGKLSMPAAEAFGSLLMASAMSRVSAVKAVIAVTDCQPAAFAINSAHSPSEPMQLLIEQCRLVARQWLAVHIPRELNTIADALSHPQRLQEVMAGARACGLTPVLLSPSADDWSPLRSAATLPPKGWEW